MSEIILAEYKNIKFICSENNGEPFFTTNSNLSSLIFAIPELTAFYDKPGGELDMSLLTPNSIASKKALTLISKIIDEELKKAEKKDNE